MLRILRLRARYLNNRGATLNNPHIPTSFLRRFTDQAIDLAAAGDGKVRRRVRLAIRRITMASAKLRSVAKLGA